MENFIRLTPEFERPVEYIYPSRSIPVDSRLVISSSTIEPYRLISVNILNPLERHVPSEIKLDQAFTINPDEELHLMFSVGEEIEESLQNNQGNGSKVSREYHVVNKPSKISVKKHNEKQLTTLMENTTWSQVESGDMYISDDSRAFCFITQAHLRVEVFVVAYLRNEKNKICDVYKRLQLIVPSF